MTSTATASGFRVEPGRFPRGLISPALIRPRQQPSGLLGTMDREDQLSFSLGLSATLLGNGGGITRQISYSEAATAFVDVDGDGLLDFVTIGSNSYAKE